MATETGPDLTTAVTAVERLMDDTCCITRPVDGVEQHLSQATGELVYAPSDLTLVYEGKCKVKLKSSSRYQQSGSETGRQQWLGGIPVDGPLLAVGDEWTMTSARRDQQLVGRKFRIVSTVGNTLAVQRRVVLEEITD